MRVYFFRKEQEDLSLDRVLPGVCQPMLFPTERTKQGQLRFPGSEVSALTLYRVHEHQILNISTKLSQTGASQLLSKKMKIDESNPISWQQCQSLLSLLPVGTKCSWILPVKQGIFNFFFLVTLLCPALCPRGKCPPSCLCSSHNLCFVYCHINIYNSKPLWFPAQTEGDVPQRAQCLQHLDQGALFPRHGQTHPGLRGSEGEVPQMRNCGENVQNMKVQASSWND